MKWDDNYTLGTNRQTSDQTDKNNGHQLRLKSASIISPCDKEVALDKGGCICRLESNWTVTCSTRDRQGWRYSVRKSVPTKLEQALKTATYKIQCILSADRSMKLAAILNVVCKIIIWTGVLHSFIVCLCGQLSIRLVKKSLFISVEVGVLVRVGQREREPVGNTSIFPLVHCCIIELVGWTSNYWNLINQNSIRIESVEEFVSLYES